MRVHSAALAVRGAARAWDSPGTHTESAGAIGRQVADDKGVGAVAQTMSGTVDALAGGFVSVATPGGYVVLELMGSAEPDIGDRITGIERRHGSQTVRDDTQHRDLRVFVQAIDATPAGVEEIFRG